jgi:hypothetical protein
MWMLGPTQTGSDGSKLLCQMAFRGAGQHLPPAVRTKLPERPIIAESSAHPNGQKPTAATEQDQVRRDILPIPDAKNVGLTTYDAKDPDTTRRHPRSAPRAHRVVGQVQGKFDGGWDALREQIIARQKELGVVPADAELTRRHDEIPAWDEHAR